MPICHNDATFTSDDPEDIKLAVALCVGCPFIQECGEAGLGEKWGVWGGMAPHHPDRKAQRAVAAKTKATHCINGHAIEDYGWDIDGGSQKALTACRRCAALLLHIAEAKPGTPMPATEPRKYDPIPHGTEAGYKAHKRRDEDACGRCVAANNEAQRDREPEGSYRIELYDGFWGEWRPLRHATDDDRPAEYTKKASADRWRLKYAKREGLPLDCIRVVEVAA